MSETTLNYAFIKPELEDEVGQTMGVDMPSNLDQIDTLIKELKTAVNPKYFDYFKNMIQNSSFEIFDPDTLLPSYWAGTGVANANSNFSGDYSCLLQQGGYYIEHASGSRIDPNWYDNAITRVSFHRKQGQMQIEVYDHTNSEFFTLTHINDAGDTVTGIAILTDITTNWQDSKASVTFNPQEHGACSSLGIKISNQSVSQDGYVDCVMLTPDLNNSYTQIYKDGPKSRGIQGYQGIWVSDTEPPDHSYLWLDIS